MTTDPLPTSTALTIGFPQEEMADVKAQAAACGMSASDWVRELVREKLARARGEWVEGARSITEFGWTREQAAVVRAQLSAFAEDWDDPEMDVYDDIGRERVDS